MNQKYRLIIFIIIAAALAVSGYMLRKDYSRTLIKTVTYACDHGKTITASYYQGPPAPTPAPGQPPHPTGSAVVSIDGAPAVDLNQTISADGIRYANSDESLVFWSKGASALIMRNNSMDLDYTNCNAQ